MSITYQTIINEINQINVVFLQDVYNMVHSFNTLKGQKEQNREKILQLAGSWSDMSDENFSDMTEFMNTHKSV